MAALPIVLRPGSMVPTAIPIWPLVALAAAIGAIQQATIIAQPIPQFKKGIKRNPKKQWAIVDEAGQEMIIKRSGEVEMGKSDGARLTQLDVGDEVVPHKDVRKRLSAMSDRRIRPYNDKLSTKRMEQLQESQIAEQRKTNERLGRFKYEYKGKLYNLDGDEIRYV